MLVLDENIPEDQRQLLREWRIRFRVIGVDLGRSGTADENLIPLLRKLSGSTFFSLDKLFSRPAWLDSRYCLVWLDVRRGEVALFVKRLLRHRQLNTRSKRMGKIVRAIPTGFIFGPLQNESSTFWTGKVKKTIEL